MSHPEFDATDRFEQTIANIFELARTVYPNSPASFLLGLGSGRLLREGVSVESIRCVFEQGMRAAKLNLDASRSAKSPSEPPS